MTTWLIVTGPREAIEELLDGLRLALGRAQAREDHHKAAKLHTLIADLETAITDKEAPDA
jgi:hypothetical protein